MSTEALHARQVEAMAGYGLPAEDIAQVLRIDVEELRRHYADELEDGRIKANSRVAENLFRKATGEGREAVTERSAHPVQCEHNQIGGGGPTKRRSETRPKKFEPGAQNGPGSSHVTRRSPTRSEMPAPTGEEEPTS